MSSRPSLVGTYKLVSFAIESDDEPAKEIFGKNPLGYIVITPRRFTVIFTAENRRFGLSVSEKAALWETMTSYSGLYRVEGDKLIVSVDVSWNESWNATRQVRFWQAHGNRLSLTSLPAPYPRDPSKIYSVRASLEKIE